MRLLRPEVTPEIGKKFQDKLEEFIGLPMSEALKHQVVFALRSMILGMYHSEELRPYIHLDKLEKIEDLHIEVSANTYNSLSVNMYEYTEEEREEDRLKEERAMLLWEDEDEDEDRDRHGWSNCGYNSIPD